MDVGHLRRSTRPFYVQKPNFSEDYPEEAIREGADELTLRAEDVKTLKACINIDHTDENRLGPPLVDADWNAFCIHSLELKGKNGRSCIITTEK